MLVYKMLPVFVQRCLPVGMASERKISVADPENGRHCYTGGQHWSVDLDTFFAEVCHEHTTRRKKGAIDGLAGRELAIECTGTRFGGFTANIRLHRDHGD